MAPFLSHLYSLATLTEPGGARSKIGIIVLGLLCRQEEPVALGLVFAVKLGAVLCNLEIEIVEKELY